MPATSVRVLQSVEARVADNIGVGDFERRKLAAAANLFCHAVTANIGHDVMLKELKRTIDLLKVDIPTCGVAQPRSKPILRVIEGGLSRAV